MFDKQPSAAGLKLGRPDNRRYRYQGDRRDIVEQPRLLGPDAHGVFWWPVRCYYEKATVSTALNSAGGTTLVVFEPVHPDHVAERM